MKQVFFALILVFGFGFSVFAQNQNSLCAKIEVTGGGVVQAGEPLTFTANVTGKTKTLLLEYEWTISNGTISSGQGTPSITVDTTGLSDTNITAEVKIKGLYDNCPNTASMVSSITVGCGLHRLFDEFAKLPDDHIFARIHNLFVELNNNPEAQGLIINYGTDKGIASRERQIKKAISSLKLEANRITIVRGGENPNGAGVWTKVWIAPPGAEFPKP